MIFITLGSQKFQFDRLLKKIDELIENKVIQDEVFAQIGYCTYIPKNFKSQQFLDRESFLKNMNKADLVMTHAGTGAIMSGLKAGKKVIAIPRLKKYGEHVDDHQVQIIEQFSEMGIIEPCYDVENLEKAIYNCQQKQYIKYKSSKEKFIKNIEEYIENA